MKEHSVVLYENCNVLLENYHKYLSVIRCVKYYSSNKSMKDNIFIFNFCLLVLMR